MKYGLIGVIVIIVGLFYFMHKSNKDDAARVAASGQAYTEQQNKTVKVAELQKRMPDLRDSIAIKLIESPKMSSEDILFYKNLSGKWADTLKVAEATARISLSDPVQELQKLKRDLDARQPKTDCEDIMRSSLLNSYEYTIDGFLEFMKDNKEESDINSRVASSSMDNAIFLLDYCRPS